MLGLDDRLAELGGGSLLLTLIVALLLGLRHATDPDHLTAVSTLALGEGRAGARRAGRLGLAWGLGHAVTVVALGVPVVAFGSHLPEALSHAAELVVGMLIVALSARLLLRWRRGTLHMHPHRHGDVTHVHPHAHELAGATEHARGHAHDHAHEEALGRTPAASFAIGLVHGVGGSAGVGILVVAGAAQGGAAALALLVMAVGTVAAMAGVSAAFGRAMTRERVARLRGVVPVYGAGGIAFGAWYLLAALETAPYPF